MGTKTTFVCDCCLREADSNLGWAHVHINGASGNKQLMPDDEGVRDIPRLGGLAYFYLKGRLEQWGQGYHSGTSSPMPMVAGHLGPDEIEALASYLSFVK
jgi:cytochrome c553